MEIFYVEEYTQYVLVTECKKQKNKKQNKETSHADDVTNQSVGLKKEPETRVIIRIHSVGSINYTKLHGNH